MRQYLSLAFFILLIGGIAWGIISLVRSGVDDEPPVPQRTEQGVAPRGASPAGRVPQNVPASDRILLGTPAGSVSVKNFYRAVKDVEEMAIVILKTDTHFISYDTQISRFWIAFTEAPFEAARSAAEQDFLTLLDASKEDACKLDVAEGVTYGANPGLSGQSYRLSFCAGAVQ